jgi:diguanylate cyclase (GGDEF)-like protein/PAS domain S-box-containing protein
MSETTIRVLLVDDDEDDYILTKEFLREISNTKYHLDWVSDYSTAFEKATNQTYDLHLVDYQLGGGGKTGIDLVRSLIAGNVLTPTIILTGQDSKERDHEAMMVGVYDYLLKSEVDAQTLERAIRYALQRSETEKALRQSESRFRSVIQNLSDVITILDSDFKINYASPSAKSIFFIDGNQLIGTKLTDFCHPEDETKLNTFLLELSNKQGLRSVEWRTKIDENTWCYVESVGTNLLDDPNVCGNVVTTRNTNERKILESRLTHQAFHDSLTGLANRVLFRDRVEHALLRAKRQKSSISVMFLDLDNFKNINDTLGHAIGDELLVAIGENLELSVREIDTVARLGGDEFAILLEETVQPADSICVAKRILQHVQRIFHLQDKDVLVGLSIGIAVSQQGLENADELLRNADVAMYIAKERGKGQFAVFETELHNVILAQMELETDLRKALGNNEFKLLYQPILNLETLQIRGVEALIRWHHPTRGVVSPNDFIPLAETTGLIVPIGQWVLEKACQQLSKISANDKELSITINISGKQLQNPDFVRETIDTISNSGVKPEHIILEITESQMIENVKTTHARLCALKAFGVRLALDDFGTGYSSLNCLHQFPIDILKIDKSFVDGISDGTETAAVAKTIIALSEALKLQTIAEGIEKPQQVDTLKQFGCRYGQGFYFAKPMDEFQLEEVLMRNFIKFGGNTRDNTFMFFPTKTETGDYTN